MPFTHPVPDWNAQGAEPPESLKTAGWGINQKPPADYFNWFFYNSAKALIELQLEAVNIDQKGVPDGLATLGADGKVPASQLNVSAPPDATTTQKGVVQLSNSTTSTEDTKAATPKAVKDAKDGLSNQIGTLSGLNTTNKSNLVSAINEVFLTGNNVKSDMVAALLAVDPTLPITTSSSWAEIETATGQISTGKKFATGTITIPANQNFVEVRGLDFSPSTIKVRRSAESIFESFNFDATYCVYRSSQDNLNWQRGSYTKYVDGFKTQLRQISVNDTKVWIAYE